MRVLIFRHVPFEGAGYLELALRERDIPFDYADLYEAGAPSPEPADYDALVFLGGPMSVNDPLDYLRREEQYIRDAVTRGTPVLGICLGSQLIAKAMGAHVRKNQQKEIGWFEVRRTPVAANDLLFRNFGVEEVFHWHGETFDLPPGAELLASSALCANQAFRIGARIYGMQFHLEVTPAMIEDWFRQDENDVDVRGLTLIPDPNHNSARKAALASQVFGAWCDGMQVALLTPGDGLAILKGPTVQVHANHASEAGKQAR
jgi:GMP synthase-like glutamine amidotransferase